MHRLILTAIALATCLSLTAGEVEECRRIAGKYNGTVEHRLWDATRVDILNDEYAIEVDYSQKWAESIGQSLYYAQVSGKKPGVILLVSDFDAEAKYIYRLQTVAAKYGIAVWLEKVEKPAHKTTNADGSAKLFPINESGDIRIFYPPKGQKFGVEPLGTKGP